MNDTCVLCKYKNIIISSTANIKGEKDLKGFRFQVEKWRFRVGELIFLQETFKKDFLKLNLLTQNFKKFEKKRRKKIDKVKNFRRHL